MRTSSFFLGLVLSCGLAGSAQAQGVPLAPLNAALPGILAGTGLTATSSSAALQVLVVGAVVGTDEDAVTTSSTASSGH